MNFATAALSVVSLLLLAVPGFVLIKTKLIKTTIIPALVTILLYINQPFITIYALISKPYDNSMLVGMGIVILVAFATQLLVMGLAKLVFFKDPNKPRGNAYTFASSLGNVGFMGIPVVSVLMPGNAEALLYVALYMTTFNILSWTIGVYVLTGDKKFISVKKAIINPPIIALIIALPLFFLNVKVPDALMMPIKFLADMNTPLAMIVLGMRFAEVKFKELFVGLGMYGVSFVKLIFTPLLVYGVLYAIPMSYTVKLVLIIISAMPSANMVLMMAEKFDGDCVAAVKAVMNTTILSMLTIPLMMLLPVA